jgi:hypothetical protein
MAGREYERDLAFTQHVGKRIDPLTIKVDIKDRGVDPFRVDDVEGLGNRSQRPDDARAMFFKLSPHAMRDQLFIFDDENMLAAEQLKLLNQIEASFLRAANHCCDRFAPPNIVCGRRFPTNFADTNPCRSMSRSIALSEQARRSRYSTPRSALAIMR